MKHDPENLSYEDDIEATDDLIEADETPRVFEINSWQTLAQYLGMVALNVPGALIKILGNK